MNAKTEKQAADTPAAEEQTATKPKLVEVVAAKAFLGANGWVQKGEKAEVTPDRKKDLARNGLIEGATAEAPEGSRAQTSRRLNVA